MNNAVVASFVEFAKFLDARHDQHERIVKISRDITIESKRAIFLLHRIQGESDPEILKDAKKKLDDIRYRFWFYIAKELQHGDPFLFLRAYTAGLQEYIEALSFYFYCKEGRLISWREVQDNLTFKSSSRRESNRGDSHREASGDQLADPDAKQDDQVGPGPVGVADAHPECEDSAAKEVPEGGGPDVAPDVTQTKPEDKDEPRPEADPSAADADSSINIGDDVDADVETTPSRIVLVPKRDFLLGIADLTGEMMRKAITSAAAGNTNVCFTIFADLQDIYASFLSLNRDGQREMSRKISVLEASLKKVENVCYKINVSMTEVPKHLIGTFMALHEATSTQDNRNQESEEIPSYD